MALFRSIFGISLSSDCTLLLPRQKQDTKNIKGVAYATAAVLRVIIMCALVLPKKDCCLHHKKRDYYQDALASQIESLNVEFYHGALSFVLVPRSSYSAFNLILDQ